MTSNAEQTRARIRQTGIIAILRGDFAFQDVLKIAEALVESGIPTMEITLNSRNALEAISALRQQFANPQLLIGAGTVRTAEQVDAALNAGAQFIVAPNFDPASVARAQADDVLHIPGVFTPTEAQQAFAAGCRMLKLFPADAMGPAYLKALRAPLNDIEFVPTGGTTAENLADYVRAGAAAVGVGSALISGPHQPISEIATRARVLRTAWKQGHYDRTPL